MRKHMFYAAVFAAVLLALFGCAAQTTSSAEQSPQRPTATVASFGPQLAQGLATNANTFGDNALETCLSRWFSAYVASRVVPIDPTDRDSQSFGPWLAQKDYGTTDASEDGSLTEWADNYYITHDWSDIGQQILTLIPGDTVTINGRSMRVEGIFNYPKDSYYDEITELIGTNVIGLQTCYPSSDYNRVVYGTAI